MYLDKDFRLIKRDKYITWSIVGFFFLIAVAMFIATSWYSNDLAMSNFFNKAMKYSFFKGWTAFFITDANVLLISILVPIFFILVESLYKYLKNNKPNSFGARHYKDKKWFYIVVSVVYVIVIWLFLAQVDFYDYGFGKGFLFWNIVGWEYLIPIYIVDGLLNMAIYFSLVHYITKDLSKRENFLSSKLWLRVFVVYLFTIIIYVIMAILKNGFGRPYLMFINWDQYMDKIYDYSPERYEHYINQTSKVYGWNDGSMIHGFPNDMQEWPWWKIGKGYFNKNSSYYNMLPVSEAFPSGHMGMVSIMITSLWYVLFSDEQSKKQRTLKWTMLGLGIFLILNMFFSLEISENHWASDMAFTIIEAPIDFIISYYIVTGIAKQVSKNSANK